MATSSPLPRALRANALASLVTGMAAVLMSAPIAQTVGLLPGTAYQVIGGALIAHVLFLLWASGRARIATWTRVNLAGLIGYIALQLWVLAACPIATPLGRGLLIGDALLVAGLAVWQWRALSAAMPRPAR